MFLNWFLSARPEAVSARPDTKTSRQVTPVLYYLLSKIPVKRKNLRSIRSSIREIDHAIKKHGNWASAAQHEPNSLTRHVSSVLSACLVKSHSISGALLGELGSLRKNTGKRKKEVRFGSAIRQIGVAAFFPGFHETFLCFGSVPQRQATTNSWTSTRSR